MAMFLLALLFILAAMAGLAAGTMAQRTPLQGSCGGLACRCRGECRAGHRPDRADGHD